MKKRSKEEQENRDYLKELVEIGSITPFSTPKGEFYCTINTGEINKNYLLTSPSFRVAFKSVYNKYTHEIINDNQYKNMLDELEVLAFDNKLSYMLSNRICRYDNDILYDLSELENLCVKISEGSYKIEESPKMLFKRTNIQADQERPDFSVDETSLPKMLKVHLNIPSKKLRDLYSIWLVSCFFPDIQHMILAVYGEKGSSKSTLLQRTVQIIDPVIKGAELNSMPKKSDLGLRLSASLVSAFDNVSPQQLKNLSDLFCQTVTGSISPKRKLYDDLELILINLRSIVLLDGTELVISRSDLMERAILLPMKKLKSQSIRNENEMETAFRAELPRILGACLKLVATASNDTVPITTGHKTRVASFYDVAIRVGRAMGFEDEYTDELLMMNRKRGNQEVLKDSIIAECLSILMADHEEYKNSVSGLLSELKEIGKSLNIPLAEFPNQPNRFSRELNALKSNLEAEYGITYSIRNAGKYREICIVQDMETGGNDNV